MVARPADHDRTPVVSRSAPYARIGVLFDMFLYFEYYRNRATETMPKKEDPELIARCADRLSAMGTEPRLRIVRLLLSAHPEGMVVGEVGDELGIPSSTLSHHLEKLKQEDLVRVRREGTYLWYSANTEALQELLGFLFAECCTRNRAIEPRAIARLCK